MNWEEHGFINGLRMANATVPFPFGPIFIVAFFMLLMLIMIVTFPVFIYHFIKELIMPNEEQQ